MNFTHSQQKFTTQILLMVMLTASACSCNAGRSAGIQVHRTPIVDTIEINITGQIQQIIKKGKYYYCLFAEDRPYTSVNTYFLYWLSENGSVLGSLSVPEDRSWRYSDLHIRNDSVILKNYYDHSSHFLDEECLEWVEIEEVDDRVFEDEAFYVSYLNFGEFGGTLWFIDKSTKRQFELGIGTPVINKFHGRYYLTTSRCIVEIVNPLDLQECTSDSKYEVVEKKEWSMGSFFQKGANVLFCDSSYVEYPKFYIATSFVQDHQLKNLCIDDGIAYVAELKEGVLIPSDTIGEDIWITKDYHSYRRNLEENNVQVLQFMAKEESSYGIIEIDGDKMHLHYLINRDTALYLGHDQAYVAFDSLFNFITEQLGTLYLNQVDHFELSLGASNATPGHEMSIGTSVYPNSNSFDLESPIVYKTIEDSSLTLLKNYYYTARDSTVKVLDFEWVRTHENAYGIYAPENDSILYVAFQERFRQIENLVTNKLGPPSEIIPAKNGKYFWWRNCLGINIRLYVSNPKKYPNIHITIFGE